MASIEVTQTVRKQITKKTTSTEERYYENEDEYFPRPSSRVQTSTTKTYAFDPLEHVSGHHTPHQGRQTPNYSLSGTLQGRQTPNQGRQTPVQGRQTPNQGRSMTPNPYNYADDDYFPLSTRNQRLRDALFPDNGSRIGAGRSSTALTAVQRLSEPAQSFKHVVINLINYQEDCDTALKATPDLVHLLRQPDQNTQHRALYVILQLARKHASRYGLAASDDLIRALITLLESSREDDITELTLACLYHISGCEQGARCIVRYLTIPLLVRLLSHPVPKIANYALTILHNLLLLVEESKPIVRQCEGVQRMCELLSHPDVKVLAVLVDCLHLLSFTDTETKLAILSNEGPQQLVKIMRTYTYEKLLFVTARLLKVLSVCSENKPVIVACGGVQALAPHLDSGSGRLMMACLWTLRNLSDQAYHLTDVDPLIFSLIQLLSNTNDHVTTCACGCLCNLTCQNPHNKRVLVKARGVEALCRALKQYLDHEEVTEPICCALRHATHLHDLCGTAQMLCLEYEGVQCVARLLLDMHHQVIGGLDSGDRNSYGKALTAFSWPLLKAILGLLGNLALNDKNRVVLRDLGVVPVVCNSLLRAYTGAQEIAQQRGSVVSMQSELSFVDGVRLEDMCELALTALQAFAHDNDCREVILRSPDLLAISVQILYHTSEYLQRAATSLLSELAVGPRGAHMIEQEGATSRLTQLLHSPDEAVAAYSAVCLYRLSQDKPEEYRRRLLDELRESLKDVGLVKADDIVLALAENPYPQYQSPAISNGRAGSTVPLVLASGSTPSRSIYQVRDLDHPIQYSTVQPPASSSGGHVNLAYNATYDTVEDPRARQQRWYSDVDV